MTVKVLFVCLGNICRSPLAQGIFERQVSEAKLQQAIEVDSCGTAAFNIGKSPDPRAQAAAKQSGYNISQQIARQIDDDDYLNCDYVIAMDRINLTNVQAWAPKDFAGEIELFQHYNRAAYNAQVPDPYYGEQKQFDQLISTLESAAAQLLEHIRVNHGL